MNLVQTLICPLCETVIMSIWMHISTSSHTLSSEISFYWLANIAYNINKTDVVDDTNSVYPLYKVFNSPIHHFYQLMESVIYVLHVLRVTSEQILSYL